jgi:VCBS repeat-containing protein
VAITDTIKQYYENILQRPASDDEADFWAEKVDAGEYDLAQVRDAFINSQEGQHVQDIVRLYQGSFNRVPDAGGLKSWVQSGRPLDEIAEGFTNSDEFHQLYETNEPTEAFITSLYRNVLGREPDSEGLNNWMNSGLSANQILIGFTESVEFRGEAGAWVGKFLDRAGEGKNVYEGTLYNDAPTAGAPVALSAINEDSGTVTILSADLLTNARDVDGDDLTVKSVIVDPAAGVLVDNQDGTWSFTPAADFSGNVTFNVVVTDGALDVATTATLLVNSVNDAPVAGASVVIDAIDEDAGVVVISATQLLANVTDVDGDELSVQSVIVDPAAGVLVDNEDGTWSFTPAADFNGNVTFDVVVTDGTLDVATTATLLVNSVNDAPVALPDFAEMNEDDAIVTGQLIATDVEDDVAGLTFSLVGAPVPGLTINPDGSYEFNPSDEAYQSLAEGVFSPLLVTYQVVDSEGAVTTAQLTLELTGVNDAPVAEALIESVTEDALLEGQLIASDVDGDELTFSLNGGSLAGLTINADGTYTFDASHPDYQSLKAGETQEVTASYEVTDTNGASDISTLTFTVTGVNDIPAVISGNNTGRLVDGVGRETLASTATVADPENNFAGGSLTVTASSSVTNFQIPAVGFYVVAGKLVADKTLLAGATVDQVIGSVTSSSTELAISFTSPLVTSSVVETLLRGITVGDAIGSQDLLLTVSLKDGAQAESKFDLVYDVGVATEFASFANIGEVEVSDGVRNTTAPFSLFGNSAVLNVGGAKIDGAILEITGGIDGDLLKIDGTTFRYIGTQDGYDLVYNDGSTDLIIGTATAIPGVGDSLVITLNSNATDANIDTLLQKIQVDLAPDLGNRPFTAAFRTADGWTEVTKDTTLEVITNLNEVDLSDLASATSLAPVVINGNVLLTIDGTLGAPLDIGAKILSGAIVLETEPGIMRIVTSQIADISNVTGLDQLGDYSFYSVSHDLTVTAAQADNRVGTVYAGTLNVTKVELTPAVNLWELVEDGGTIIARIDTTNAPVTFTGTLGSADLVVTGTNALTVSASIADETSITFTGGTINITSLDGEDAYDLTGVVATTIKAAIDEDTTLDTDTVLGTARIDVGLNATLTLTGDQADGRIIAGVNIVGDGNKGGSVVVTDLTTGTDLHLITGGVWQVGATNWEPSDLTVLVKSTDTGAVDGVVTATGLNLGSFIVQIEEEATLRTDISISQKTIEGAGNIVVAAAGPAILVDLSNISVDGTKLLEVAKLIGDNPSLNAATDLGDFHVSVAAGADFSLTAAQADGKTIDGVISDALHAGGSVTITTLGNAAYDLSGITAGAQGVAGVAGTLVAMVEDDNVTLNSTTDLGSFTIHVTDGDGNSNEPFSLTLTAAQADGRLIEDLNDLGHITVTDLASDTDLSQIDVSNGVEATVSAVIDISENTNLTKVTSYVVNNSGSLTISARQADAMTITHTLGTVIIAGDLVSDLDNAIDLRNVGTFTFDDDSIDVDAGVTLTLTAAQASGKTITGAGNVTVTGLGGSAVDLSGITVTGTKSVQVPTTTSLNTGTNLGTFEVDVLASATLTMSLTQAEALADLTGAGTAIVNGTSVGDDMDFSGKVGWDIDHLTLSGLGGADFFRGPAGVENITITGGLGADIYEVLTGTVAHPTVISDFNFVVDELTIGADGVTKISVSASTDFAALETANRLENNGVLIVDASTASADVVIQGSAGSDYVIGSSHNDTINAKDGADIIRGGAGNDTINLSETSPAIDRVIFEASTNGEDTISNFTAGITGDILDFSNFTLNGTGFATANSSLQVVAGANKVIVVTDNASNNWSDVDTVVNAAISGGDNIVNNEKAIIAISNGTDTNIYKYIDDATAGVTAPELTLVGTLTAVTTTNLVSHNFDLTGFQV